MAEFINTVDRLGDEAVIDSIINRTITEFKDDKLTEVGHYAFFGCTNLETVDCPAVISIDSYAFDSLVNLKNINFPSVEVINALRAFYGCQIEKMIFPSLRVLSNSYPLGNMPLKILDLWKIEEMGSMVFFGTHPLEALFLRNTAKVCTCKADPLSNSAINRGTGYIYVPKMMNDGTDGIAAYEAATVWSKYGGKFRYVEDYTVDGTITGEIDESKI